MTIDLAKEEASLLVLLQSDFPLVPWPFIELGARLGRSETDVLAQCQALKARGIIRQIGAIFDTRRLGYSSTLVALQVAPEHLDEVAVAISRHPGVSHNYSRDHVYNLWFTLAVPPGRDVNAEAHALAEQSGVRRVLLLPTVRTFKIDVRFDLGLDNVDRVFRSTKGSGVSLCTEDIPMVRALQHDLPLMSQPFAALAQLYGLTEASLLEGARRLLATGIMRRYGATLRHTLAGYPVNAMACWEVPEERIEAAGRAAALCAAVSHCYQRPAWPPDWPYGLFTMIHAQDEAGLQAAIAEITESILPLRFAVLRTLREYKKVRLQYFVEGAGVSS